MTRRGSPSPEVRILVRMLSLAELIVAEPRSPDLLATVEDFAACAYQLGLDVPPPDVEVQDVLAARALLVRPYTDPEDA